MAFHPGRRRRLLGLMMLNLAAALVLVGACYDLFVPRVPPNHIRFIAGVEGQINPRMAQLDLAMLRSIGGCLAAIGITCLGLVNGPVRRGDRWAAIAVVVLIGVAEGNNAWRMVPFGSPWYGPAGFALLALGGFALVGRKQPGRS